MLNKYFTYENFEVSLNRPELLLVKEFEDLMSKDFNNNSIKDFIFPERLTKLTPK